jgi:heptosyltransferase-2
VGLHLGASFGPSKLWPPESFARLAAHLSTARLTPLLLGSPDDRETAAAVIAATRRPPASLVGRDRPALLPRLLARVHCLVSGDTGIAHLAAAGGVPTVTLFGPTDPRFTAPRGPAARAVSHATPCSPCFLASCPIEHVCLRGIDADRVALEVRRLAAA